MSQFNVLIEDSAGNQYFPKPDLLTTKEQLAANNAAGKSVDALVVKEINNNLDSHPQFIYDNDGKITGYKTKAGADTVFPFFNIKQWSKTSTISSNKNIDITSDTKFLLIYARRTDSGVHHALWTNEYQHQSGIVVTMEDNEKNCKIKNTSNASHSYLIFALEA